MSWCPTVLAAGAPRLRTIPRSRRAEQLNNLIKYKITKMKVALNPMAADTPWGTPATGTLVRKMQFAPINDTNTRLHGVHTCMTLSAAGTII